MSAFWKRLLRNPSGLIGLVILVIAVAIAIFGPLIFPTSPWRVIQRPFVPTSFGPPNSSVGYVP